MKPGDRVRIKQDSLLRDTVGDVRTVDNMREYSVYVVFDSWSHWFKPEELELVNVQPSGDERPEGERLKEFFFGKRQQFDPQGEAWRSEGKCPWCGETGHVHLSAFVCSKHGVYS